MITLIARDSGGGIQPHEGQSSVTPLGVLHFIALLFFNKKTRSSSCEIEDFLGKKNIVASLVSHVYTYFDRGCDGVLVLYCCVGHPFDLRRNSLEVYIIRSAGF